MSQVEGIMRSISQLPKKDRDYIYENIFGVIQKAQREEEKRTWLMLCHAVEKWKQVTDTDEIILEAEDGAFILCLNPDEPGDCTLKTF